jgi:branched-chain amino acid transport system substrate-binding protein
VGGEITFDDMHDVQTGKGKMNLIFAQWQDKGERAVIYPKELRTGNFILPPWMKK